MRLSNQGADIDACADKSANTGNKINKDFEERVTANFAQWSAPHSRVMFLIERATPENSCSMQGRGREHSTRSSAAFALFKLFLFSSSPLSVILVVLSQSFLPARWASCSCVYFSSRWFYTQLHITYSHSAQWEEFILFDRQQILPCAKYLILLNKPGRHK